MTGLTGGVTVFEASYSFFLKAGYITILFIFVKRKMPSFDIRVVARYNQSIGLALGSALFGAKYHSFFINIFKTFYVC